MTPLRDDILTELHKRPLSAKQAAEAVGTKYQYALIVLSQLCDLGMARRKGFTSPPRPSALFEFCQPQSTENPLYARTPEEA